MQETLSFTVDSALLKELGEKLVETVHVALSELVKNSYDADASEVEVIFDTNKSGGNQIRIIDNGTGMNFEAVQKYWMRIATTNKEKKNISSVYGRYLTGAKGIGRFSCRRLGAKLTLITNGTKDGNLVGEQKNIEQTIVEFPWTEFEAGQDITEIKCVGSKTTLPIGYTGTTLIIGDITSEWNNRGLNWLKRQLAVLSANRGIRRINFQEDPGFLVMLTAPNFEGGIRDLREDFINAGWGTLKAYINNDGQAVCELNALGIGRRSIVSNITFPSLNDVSLDIGIMVEDKEQLRDKSVVSLSTLNHILSNWGGVQVRYRSFRVYPYGNDDWLNIDRDRGIRKGKPNHSELFEFANSLKGVNPSKSLLNMLSMKNYIGNIIIGNKADGFEMKANREGFLESEATIELKKFVRFAIDWSTILRDFSIRQKKLKRAEIAKEAFEQVVDNKIQKGKTVETALIYLESRIKAITETIQSNEKRNEVENSLSVATEAIRTYNESIKVELSYLRLVASTSSLLLIFSHEVKSLLGLLEQSKNSLRRIARTLSGDSQIEVNEIGGSFTDLNDRLEELLQLTSLISTNKVKTTPGSVALKSKVKKVKKIFELIIGKYEIEIDYTDIPNNIVIRKILEAELYSILINVISNSIKAVIAGGTEKKIKLSAKVENGKNVITIRDSGIGLDTNRFEEVFVPFIADPDGELYLNLEKRLNPEDNMIVGTGSGLGLGIVKAIVDAHGGSVQFNETNKPWSTEMEIRLI